MGGNHFSIEDNEDFDWYENTNQIDEKYIENYKYKINWESLCKNKHLNEKLILKMYEILTDLYINHNNRIFIYSKLHENFWIFIFKYQKIIFSKDLLIKYIFIVEPVYKNLQINKYYLNKLKNTKRYY